MISIILFCCVLVVCSIAIVLLILNAIGEGQNLEIELQNKAHAQFLNAYR